MLQRRQLAVRSTRLTAVEVLSLQAQINDPFVVSWSEISKVLRITGTTNGYSELQKHS
jgi:hypothetical protein